MAHSQPCVIFCMGSAAGSTIPFAISDRGPGSLFQIIRSPPRAHPPTNREDGQVFIADGERLLSLDCISGKVPPHNCRPNPPRSVRNQHKPRRGMAATRCSDCRRRGSSQRFRLGARTQPRPQEQLFAQRHLCLHSPLWWSSVRARGSIPAGVRGLRSSVSPMPKAQPVLRPPIRGDAERPGLRRRLRLSQRRRRFFPKPPTVTPNFAQRFGGASIVDHDVDLVNARSCAGVLEAVGTAPFETA